MVVAGVRHEMRSVLFEEKPKAIILREEEVPHVSLGGHEVVCSLEVRVRVRVEVTGRSLLQTD